MHAWSYWHMHDAGEWEDRVAGPDERFDDAPRGREDPFADMRDFAETLADTIVGPLREALRDLPRGEGFAGWHGTGAWGRAGRHRWRQWRRDWYRSPR